MVWLPCLSHSLNKNHLKLQRQPKACVHRDKEIRNEISFYLDESILKTSCGLLKLQITRTTIYVQLNLITAMSCLHSEIKPTCKIAGYV